MGLDIEDLASRLKARLIIVYRCGPRHVLPDLAAFAFPRTATSSDFRTPSTSDCSLRFWIFPANDRNSSVSLISRLSPSRNSRYRTCPLAFQRAPQRPRSAS